MKSARGRGSAARPPPVGGASVYVGNLSWKTSWQDLKDHFRAAGDVSHADVMQEHDGRSKGCGIVSFVSARDAANAIRQLHDTELHGRKIFVREDREAAAVNGKGKGGGTGGWHRRPAEGSPQEEEVHQMRGEVSFSSFSRALQC